MDLLNLGSSIKPILRVELKLGQGLMSSVMKFFLRDLGIEEL